MLDEFSGTTVPTPSGGILTVHESNNLTQSDRKYRVTCSICSIDTELFGDMWIRKHCLLKGTIPCGCSIIPAWSEEQYTIMCKRKADKLNVTFIGFSEKPVRYNTKVLFKDRQGVLQGRMSIEYFLKRYDPDKIRVKSRSKALKDDKYFQEKFSTSGNFPKGTIFKRDNENLKIFTIFCPVCAESPLCISGVSSPWFKTTYSNLSSGQKPCFCCKNHVYSQEEWEFRLRQELGGDGEYIGILDEFRGNKSIFLWKCVCGSTRKQKIADFMSGKRCSVCSKSGFDSSKPANLYLVEWSLDETRFLKVGITNGDVRKRVSQQKSYTKFVPKIITSVSFQDGFSARMVEKQFLESGRYKRYHVDRNTFGDGSTELFDIEDLVPITREIDRLSRSINEKRS